MLLVRVDKRRRLLGVWDLSVGEVWSGPVISPRMWLKYLMQMMIKKIRVFFRQLLKHPSILLVYCAWNKSDESI